MDRVDKSMAIVCQPRLASEEDISDESILAVPSLNYLQDPVFEPFKNAVQFRIQQILDYVDIDDDESISIKYEVRNPRDNTKFIAKKTCGEYSNASCHDNYRTSQFTIETLDGQKLVQLEGYPGYSGFSLMKVYYGVQCIGKIKQNYDVCSICNPQYSILNFDNQKIHQISVLNGGFFCGVFGVTKFLIISGNLEEALGDIECQTRRLRPWSRKLLADELRPLEDMRVTFPSDLELESKLLLLAATFAVNFHTSIFRFRRRTIETGLF